MQVFVTWELFGFQGFGASIAIGLNASFLQKNLVVTSGYCEYLKDDNTLLISLIKF